MLKIVQFQIKMKFQAFKLGFLIVNFTHIVYKLWITLLFFFIKKSLLCLCVAIKWVQW